MERFAGGQFLSGFAATRFIRAVEPYGASVAACSVKEGVRVKDNRRKVPLLYQELPNDAICRLLLNTGLRSPREILLVEKAHVNLSDAARHYRFTRRDGRHLEGRDTIIPPGSLLVAHGKDGRARMTPLNETAHRILQVLCGDLTRGHWLFVNRDGLALGSIKKGFAAACERAKIEGLRPYDLRHTFATRLVERGIHPYVISALMGHSMPVSGFGHESRITPGYAHAA